MAGRDLAAAAQRCDAAGEPRVTVETDRLVLRCPKLADVPDLFVFLGDGEAMRHTHVDASLAECRRRIAVHEWQRRRKGYAPWTVVTKVDGRIVGWGGLYDDPFVSGWGAEIGYYFHPAVWGHGYATELMLACISLADTALQLPEVRAFARPANTSSRRVLEKAGFKEVRFVPSLQRLLFRRGRPSRGAVAGHAGISSPADRSAACRPGGLEAAIE